MKILFACKEIVLPVQVSLIVVKKYEAILGKGKGAADEEKRI